MNAESKEEWLSLVTDMKSYFYSCSSDESLGLHYVHVHLRNDVKTGEEKYSTHVFAGSFSPEDGEEVTIHPEDARQAFQMLARCAAAAGDAFATISCCEVWRAECPAEDIPEGTEIKDLPGAETRVALFTEHQLFGKQLYTVRIFEEEGKRKLGLWEDTPWIPDLYDNMVPPQRVSASQRARFRKMLAEADAFSEERA